jgi:carnitine O-acetyltransferase
MNEFVLAALAAKKVDLGPPRTPDTGKGLPTPTELKFVVNETVSKRIEDAEIAFNKLVGQHDMHVCVVPRIPHPNPHFLRQVLHYEGYGKEHIKKFKVSPDAWAQLVKQLAFHKMFGRPGVCYESTQTRKYQLGRTEVTRSASNESRAWAEAMLNPDETVSVYLEERHCTLKRFHRTPIAPPCSKRL